MSRKSCIVAVLVAALVLLVLAVASLRLSSEIGSAMNETASYIPDGNAVEPGANVADSTVDNAMDASANAVENAVDVSDNGANAVVPPPPPAPDTSANDDSEEGVGSFKKLPDMEVDNWYTAIFYVAPHEVGLGKEAGLDREGVKTKLTEPAFVYVAPAMRVTLQDDPNFEIRTKSKAEVITGPDKSATWLWNVRPLSGGERTLYATVEVLQRNPDGSFRKNVDGSFVATKDKTRSASFKVKVGTWKGFLIALQNAASLGDVLGTLFSSWRGALVALALLIGAASGVWVAIKNWGKAGDSKPS